MPIQVAQASAILDLNHALEEVVASVQQHAVATVQATLLTGSWGAPSSPSSAATTPSVTRISKSRSQLMPKA